MGTATFVNGRGLGMTPGVYVGHDPTIGEDGTDVLLTVWDDGTAEVATRPGHNQTRVTWGPPVALEVAP